MNDAEGPAAHKRRAFVPPRLAAGGHQIIIEKNLRYLGVILDWSQILTLHIGMVAKKAYSTGALARLMPNVRDPCQWKRRLLAMVVESQLYAPPVRATKVADIAGTKENLIHPQRTAAIRVI